ncbi:MAG: hypothetical protein LBB09_00745 [Rickettsiales bacterium]|jgi:hypothetical protein|nr:hypothetical protein [Rickettsiales bacterium]
MKLIVILFLIFSFPTPNWRGTVSAEDPVKIRSPAEKIALVEKIESDKIHSRGKNGGDKDQKELENIFISIIRNIMRFIQKFINIIVNIITNEKK